MKGLKEYTTLAVSSHLVSSILLGATEATIFLTSTYALAIWLVVLFFQSVANYKTSENAKVALRIHLVYLAINVGCALLYA